MDCSKLPGSERVAAPSRMVLRVVLVVWLGVSFVSLWYFTPFNPAAFGICR